MLQRGPQGEHFFFTVIWLLMIVLPDHTIFLPWSNLQGNASWLSCRFWLPGFSSLWSQSWTRPTLSPLWTSLAVLWSSWCAYLPDADFNGSYTPVLKLEWYLSTTTSTIIPQWQIGFFAGITAGSSSKCGVFVPLCSLHFCFFLWAHSGCLPPHIFTYLNVESQSNMRTKLPLTRSLVRCWHCYSGTLCVKGCYCRACTLSNFRRGQPETI